MGMLKRGYLVECDECGEEYIMADSECSGFCDCLSPEDTGNVCLSCYLGLLSMELDECIADAMWHGWKERIAYDNAGDIKEILDQLL